MSNSGHDQPLVPRRSLHKTPASVDATTQPVLTPPYAPEPQPRQPAGASVGPSPSDAPARAPAYPAASDREQERTQPQPATPRPAPRPGGVRRARLRLIRVDPWSVTKIAFLLSISFGIMCVVAVFLVVSVMSTSGLWDNVNDTVRGLLDQQPAEAFDIKAYVAIERVLGLAMLIAVLNVILITALATLGAFLYNLAASLLGGLQVTLAEGSK